MATDLEQLVVQLSADIRKFENSMARAQGVTNNRLRAIQKQATSVTGSVAGSFQRLGSAIAGGLALTEVTSEFIKFSDAALRIDNALKVAGLSGKELESVYRSLSTSAKANGAPLDALVQLYSRASQSQKELNVSSADLVSFSSNVALALRVAGTDAQSASGALLQLSQALSSGTVHAEEFNSVVEGALPIVQAAAAGLKEAGGSVGTLKSLVNDGKVSSEAFFQAFQAGSVLLRDKAAGSVLTISQRLENLQTSLIDAARRFNESSAAAEQFGAGIDQASKFVDGLNFENLIGELNRVINTLQTADQWVQNLAQNFGRLTGLSKVGDSIVSQLPGDTVKSYMGGALTIASGDAIQRRIDNAFSTQIQNVGNLTADAIKNSVLGKGADEKSGRLPAAGSKINAVSINDFKPPAGKSGSGGGSSRKSDYERETQQIIERTAALRAETEAQASVNPLVDDYGYAVERARTASDLLTAAQRSGLEAGKELTSVQQLLSGNFDGLSPKAREQATAMLALADAQAKASAQSEQLRASQDRIRQSFDDVKSMGKDAVSGFISDLRDGKSAADALSNALDRITDKLIDMAINSAFDSLFSGSSGGGGLLSLFGLGKKDGGIIKAATGGMISGPGGPRSDSIPTLLSDGEFVVNAAATSRNRALLEAINSGRVLARANGGMIARMASGGPVLRSAGGSGGNVSVVINNNSQAKVSQKTRQTANGPAIDVLIDDIVSSKLSTPGSSSRGAVASQFGLKSGLARR